uniref:Uncharacterized protein n=1 Tax=Tetranychus urticae TaxID=32264 RepID=T1L3D0_TETUR
MDKGYLSNFPEPGEVDEIKPQNSLLLHQTKPNVEDWSLVPNPVVEGWLPVLSWCIIAPLHATLFYTIPNCKTRTNLYLVTFLMSVFWIAIFSYIMVWMVSSNLKI